MDIHGLNSQSCRCIKCNLINGLNESGGYQIVLDEKNKVALHFFGKWNYSQLDATFGTYINKKMINIKGRILLPKALKMINFL